MTGIQFPAREVFLLLHYVHTLHLWDPNGTGGSFFKMECESYYLAVTNAALTICRPSTPLPCMATGIEVLVTGAR
jgi:hypothetical protein